ncbi:PRC-barrel domain-containing protein [Actinophytocola xanthii]|uniref:PRC-barrel domain-containing protein n=1 Tax=Actinophytocola xanthii TaxID=1912961 RepID=A0A1Q8C0J4_9PSEU|nr:PRC-barrel domain-containing protein [Actinophytocola xanthii]OLF07876.1 hypothetical protein BU204_35270 [Actinophytocola xanthii]
MIGQEMVNQLYDCQVVDPHGEKIGAVKRIWLDEVTGDPVWATVNIGMFGQKEIFIPLQRAELHQDQLQVPVEKAQVREAPRIEAQGDLMTPEEQQTLYQFYGMSPGGEPIGGDMSGDMSGGGDVTIGDMSAQDMDPDGGGFGTASERGLGMDDQGMQGGMGADRSGR